MDKDNKQQTYHYGLGRRKTSVAKVRLMKGSGRVTINQAAAEDYLSGSKGLLHELQLPFQTVGQEKRFDLSVIVRGGGHHSQVGAIRLGIAKALIKDQPDLKDTLKRAGLLGRDPRAKERKKFGHKGARKKQQFTKR